MRFIAYVLNLTPIVGSKRSIASNTPPKASTDPLLRDVEAFATCEGSAAEAAAFLLDWLAHHLACGVTHVVALSNDCDDGTDALLDRLDLLLTAGQLTEQTRSKVIATISALPVDDEEDRRVRVNAAILLVMISNDYLIQK